MIGVDAYVVWFGFDVSCRVIVGGVLELSSMLVRLVVVLSCSGWRLLWLSGVCWVVIVIVSGWFGDCLVGGACVVGVLFRSMMVVGI